MLTTSVRFTVKLWDAIGLKKQINSCNYQINHTQSKRVRQSSKQVISEFGFSLNTCEPNSPIPFFLFNF